MLWHVSWTPRLWLWRFFTPYNAQATVHLYDALLQVSDMNLRIGRDGSHVEICRNAFWTVEDDGVKLRNIMSVDFQVVSSKNRLKFTYIYILYLYPQIAMWMEQKNDDNPRKGEHSASSNGCFCLPRMDAWMNAFLASLCWSSDVRH